MNYHNLLKRAQKKLPQGAKDIERFEIPKIRGHIEGNKTVISNFNQICNTIHRNTQHVLKYVLKELATPGKFNSRSQILMLGTKVPASRINEKIRQYVNEFVICENCGKPETNIVSEGKFLYIKCNACGNKNTIRSKI